MTDAAQAAFSLPLSAIAIIVGIVLCLATLAGYAWWLDMRDWRDIERNGVDE